MDSIARSSLLSLKEKELEEIILTQQKKIDEKTRDITHIQNQFKEIKNKYENLYLFSPSIFFIIDRNFFINTVSFQATHFVKQDCHLLKNKSFMDFIAINSQPAFEQSMRSLFLNKNKVTCEIELLQRGGNRKYVSIESTMLDEEFILLYLNDITYIRQLESQLLEQNNSLRSVTNLLQNVTDAIASLDRNFHFKIINSSFTDFFSKIFAIKLYVGMNFLTILADFSEYKEELTAGCHNALAGKETVVVIENLSPTNENYYCFELKFSPLHKSVEEQNDLIIFIKDITEYRSQKKLKLRQQAELENANRINTMGEMASALAHEINQPLTAILLYSQSCLLRLKKETRPSPLYTQLMTLINQIILQAEHAGKIVHRMKNFIRKGASGVHYSEETDINALIKEALAFLDYELSHFQLKVHLDLDENLPYIKVDKIQIMQVILNLARNSIEAIQDLSFVPEITIKTQSTSHYIMVHFRDNGPGIPLEHMDQILNFYFTTKLQGTGLGLAICRTLVEAHGGTLRAQHHQGQGAWFIFTLPIDYQNSFDSAIV